MRIPDNREIYVKVQKVDYPLVVRFFSRISSKDFVYLFEIIMITIPGTRTVMENIVKKAARPKTKNV